MPNMEVPVKFKSMKNAIIKDLFKNNEKEKKDLMHP